MPPLPTLSPPISPMPSSSSLRKRLKHRPPPLNLDELSNNQELDKILQEQIDVASNIATGSLSSTANNRIYQYVAQLVLATFSISIR